MHQGQYRSLLLDHSTYALSDCRAHSATISSDSTLHNLRIFVRNCEQKYREKKIHN
jgi:hypothetical protein